MYCIAICILTRLNFVADVVLRCRRGCDVGCRHEGWHLKIHEAQNLGTQQDGLTGDALLQVVTMLPALPSRAFAEQGFAEQGFVMQAFAE